MNFKFNLIIIEPAIAQLAERRTVVFKSKRSLGHWFKSGSRDFFLFRNNIYKKILFRITKFRMPIAIHLLL